MLTYVADTSLFDSPARALVNTVNTVGVMGKGVALEFKRRYPAMYREYRKICRDGQFDIGKLYVYRTRDRTIINFPTKRHWKQRSKVSYIEQGLETFVARYGSYSIASVAFPQLGCGNGELDWASEVRPIMEHYLNDLPIPVLVHLFVPSGSFVPERLDPEYEREVERERISSDRMWQDLIDAVNRSHGSPWGTPLFSPRVQIDDRQINIAPPDTNGTVLVYLRDQVEDIWNALRTRGAIRLDDVPALPDQPYDRLFDLLEQLDYVRRATLARASNHQLGRGLTYSPRRLTSAPEYTETPCEAVVR